MHLKGFEFKRIIPWPSKEEEFFPELQATSLRLKSNE